MHCCCKPAGCFSKRAENGHVAHAGNPTTQGETRSLPLAEELRLLLQATLRKDIIFHHHNDWIYNFLIESMLSRKRYSFKSRFLYKTYNRSKHAPYLQTGLRNLMWLDFHKVPPLTAVSCGHRFVFLGAFPLCFQWCSPSSPLLFNFVPNSTTLFIPYDLPKVLPFSPL
jgi:hypothetical protein